MNYLHFFDINLKHIAIFNSYNLKLVYIKKNKIKNIISNKKAILKRYNSFLKSNKLLLSKKEIHYYKKTIKCELKKELSTLYLLPTLKCNIACKYCFVQELSKKKFKNLVMTDKEIESIINYFFYNSKNNIREKEIVFFGGEPLLEYKLLKKATKLIKKTDSTTNIILVTNGILLNYEIISFIKKYNIKLIISIDGLLSETNNIRPTIVKEEIINILHKNSVPFSFSITLTKNNFANIDILFNLIKNYKPFEIGINNYIHSKINNCPNEFEITNKDIADLYWKMYKKISRKGIYYEQILRRLRPFIEEKPRLQECTSCGNKIVAYPGEIYGWCEYFIMNKKYYDKGIQNIYKSFDEQWLNLMPINWSQCQTCPCIMLCGGGCRYDGFCATGNLDGRDSRRCEQDKRLLEIFIINLLKYTNDFTEIYLPTIEDKSKLYSNINVNDKSIPLQNSSRAGTLNESNKK